MLLLARPARLLATLGLAFIHGLRPWFSASSNNGFRIQQAALMLGVLSFLGAGPLLGQTPLTHSANAGPSLTVSAPLVSPPLSETTMVPTAKPTLAAVNVTAAPTLVPTAVPVFTALPVFSATPTVIVVVTFTAVSTATNTITSSPTATETPSITSTPTVTSTPRIVEVEWFEADTSFVSEKGLTLGYALTSYAEQAAITIYDQDRHLVQDLGAVPAGAGEHEIYWDGKDNLGRDVPEGLYYAILNVKRQDVDITVSAEVTVRRLTTGF